MTWPGGSRVPWEARATPWAAASIGKRAAFIVAAGAMAVLAHLVDPTWVAGAPILCPFRRLTGVPCPGCGMTRAAIALAHGDVASAVAYHPLAPLAVGLGLLGLAVWAYTGRLPRVPDRVALAGAVLVVGVWAARLPVLLTGATLA